MDVHLWVSIVTLICLICLSAFFSSSETALTSVSKVRIETLAKEEGSEGKRAKRLLKVLSDKPKMLSAILIGNNLVNILASAMATVLAVDFWGNAGVGIATGILTLLILVFGEITPKTIATQKATSMSLAVGGIILFLVWVLTPVIFILNLIVSFIRGLLGVKEGEDAVMTSEEFVTAVNLSHEEGEIEKDEREYIVNVFDFSDSRAKEVMTPWIDVTVLKKDMTYEEVLSVFKDSMYTRYPVSGDSPEDVLGIVNMKEVLLYGSSKEEPGDFSLDRYIREAFLTFEHKNTAELFDEMRLNSIPMALVIDEYGDWAGIVTLEDLLEELVGEIRDEFDSDEVDDITRLSNRDFDVLGRANLEDVCEKLPLNFKSEDYDTIGGYLTGLFDHIPKTGEIYTTEDGITLRVIAVKKSRIEKIRIKLPYAI